jgi:alanyl-tRNA synthetase
MENNQQQRIDWTSERISKTYLDFFTARGHLELPGSSLVAPNQSTYFTVAGMQPLLPYLSGEQTPPASRLTSRQHCLRTVDVDETGKTNRKLTLFHMLGNWSIGSYGRREAIEMAVELLTLFGLDLNRLHVTVFGGNTTLNLPPDEETISAWQRHGFSSEQIVPLSMEDNFWDMGANLPGPCGTCTEIFLDYGIERGCGRPECRPGCSCERFMEIWNLVFIEFNRAPDGTLSRLPFLSVDTGMGLERIGRVLQSAPSLFEIDLFRPAIDVLKSLAPVRVGSDPQVDQRARRILLDHTRAALVACLEGVLPGQEGRNSVVRRLLRRSMRQGRLLGVNGPLLSQLIEPLLQTHEFLLMPEQRANIPQLWEIIAREERQFQRTLDTGLKLLERLQPDENGVISGESIFRLHSDRGFPSDLASEILAERGLSIDWSGYKEALDRHRQVSRISVERQFRVS